jgi:hypothetical protein
MNPARPASAICNALSPVGGDGRPWMPSGPPRPGSSNASVMGDSLTDLLAPPPLASQLADLACGGGSVLPQVVVDGQSVFVPVDTDTVAVGGLSYQITEPPPPVAAVVPSPRLRPQFQSVWAVVLVECRCFGVERQARPDDELVSHPNPYPPHHIRPGRPGYPVKVAAGSSTGRLQVVLLIS